MPLTDRELLVEARRWLDDLPSNRCVKLRADIDAHLKEPAIPFRHVERNCEDAAMLWAEIHHLRNELAGPAGFVTWKDAAIAERIRRVKAEQPQSVPSDERKTLAEECKVLLEAASLWASNAYMRASGPDQVKAVKAFKEAEEAIDRLAAVTMLPQSDAEYWLRSRSAIIDAIEKAGFKLVSNTYGFSVQPAMPTQSGAHEFGDPRRAMTEDELQEFCIACSFEQDDYTEEVIRSVETRMLAKPLFVDAHPARDRYYGLPNGRHSIEHDGFEGDVIGHYTTREGKQGVVLQQTGTRVVHVYGTKWLAVAPPQQPEVPEGCTPAVPSGWKIVPDSPTYNMLVAADLGRKRGRSCSGDIYLAMLAAAPKVDQPA